MILDSLYSTTHCSYGDLNPHEFLASMKATDATFLTKTCVTNAPSLEITNVFIVSDGEEIGGIALL